MSLYFYPYPKKKYKYPGTLSKKQLWYLDYYLKKSEDLNRAYQLKEAYRLWFETAKVNGSHDLTETKNRLHHFYDLVRESGIIAFQKAIETFHNWQKEIMNSFAFDLHNGYIEGINNQTKVIKQNAFGFKRFDRFRMKILLHHQYKHIDTRVV